MTLAVSYGASLLDLAEDETSATAGELVDINQSIIGSVRYNFSKWVSFQGEISYTEAENQINQNIDSLAFTLGTILFF